MKNINEKLNSINPINTNILMNEAFAERKNYSQALKELFDKYEKTKNAPDKKYKVNTPETNNHQGKAWDVLSKYPIEIIIDKAGYSPKKIVKLFNNRGSKGGYKEVDDLRAYGKFLEEEVNNGNISKEDLIKWWEEYDEKVAKSNWFNPKFLVKKIDVARFWNPYNPKDESVLNSVINNPATLVRYFVRNRMSTEEKQELADFIVDPANQDTLKQILKSAKSLILKARPSFESSAALNIRELIQDCDFSGGDIKELLADEERENSHGYSQGANSKSNMGSAVVSVILKALNALYGFELWTNLVKNEDEWNGYELKTSFKNKVSDESLSGFLDDVDELKIKVKDLGSSKKEKDSPAVYASSFSENYYHDFQIIITKEGKEIYNNKIEKVCVGSYFYSGGW